MTSRTYKTWIRSLPCLVCGIRRGVEACHTGPRGLSVKSSDFSCIPLCKCHHRTGNESYHRLGPFRFAALFGLDIPALVERLNRMGMAGMRIHGIGRKEVSPEFTRSHCICGFRTAWYRLPEDALATLHSHIGAGEEKRDIERRQQKREPGHALVGDSRHDPAGVRAGRKGVQREAAAAKAADTVDDLLRVAGF